MPTREDQTTITVLGEVKQQLEQRKLDGDTWDAFMQKVIELIDQATA